jgi:hypothetical protein
MRKFIATLLLCGLLAACAQAPPPYPVARHPQPQRNDPIREASQQLWSVDQVMRQIQSLHGTMGRF